MAWPHRYPKNYDPENPGKAPDPERWMPRRDRKGAKKKGASARMTPARVQNAAPRRATPSSCARRETAPIRECGQSLLARHALLANAEGS